MSAIALLYMCTRFRSRACRATPALFEQPEEDEDEPAAKIARLESSLLSAAAELEANARALPSTSQASQSSEETLFYPQPSPSRDAMPSTFSAKETDMRFELDLYSWLNQIPSIIGHAPAGEEQSAETAFADFTVLPSAAGNALTWEVSGGHATLAVVPPAAAGHPDGRIPDSLLASALPLPQEASAEALASLQKVDSWLEQIPSKAVHYRGEPPPSGVETAGSSYSSTTDESAMSAAPSGAHSDGIFKNIFCTPSDTLSI
ncbi:hypothetical protein Efla_004519 [Eimeria flavescens]